MAIEICTAWSTNYINIEFFLNVASGNGNFPFRAHMARLRQFCHRTHVHAECEVNIFCKNFIFAPRNFFLKLFNKMYFYGQLQYVFVDLDNNQ